MRRVRGIRPVGEDFRFTPLPVPEFVPANGDIHRLNPRNHSPCLEPYGPPRNALRQRYSRIGLTSNARVTSAIDTPHPTVLMRPVRILLRTFAQDNTMSQFSIRRLLTLSCLSQKAWHVHRIMRSLVGRFRRCPSPPRSTSSRQAWCHSMPSATMSSR
jgi:hypothetical protein